MADVRREDWTAKKYFASPATSRSDLALLAEKGAATYKAIKDGEIERDESAAMDLGTKVHAAVLEPDLWAEECARLRERIVEKPKFEGKGAKAREQEWIAKLPADAIVCTPTQLAALLTPYRTANAMARSMAGRQTPAARRARRIIELSEREVSYTWTDHDPLLAAGPMRCRCRIDLLCMTPAGPAIADLKTTLDPSDSGFARSAAKLRYLWQSAFYGAPIFEVTGIEPAFAFICIRSKPPYEIAIHDTDPDDIVVAQQQVRAAMRALSAHIASDEWFAPWERGAKDPISGRDTGHQLLEMPAYWARETT